MLFSLFVLFRVGQTPFDTCLALTWLHCAFGFADICVVFCVRQELVDCDTYDLGCNGGMMDYSFHWIQQNGGICREKVILYFIL